MGAQQTNEDSVGGRSLIKVTRLVASGVCWTIGEAERLTGKPGNVPILIVVYQHNYPKMSYLLGPTYMNAFLQNLYREDRFYADKGFTCWSLTGPDGTEEKKTFETFSERFRRIYPGYCLDQGMLIRALPETPTLNLVQLMDILKSKDANLWEQSKWIFDGKFRFLDGQANKSNKVAFCSFPRSGNTFLRKYMELCTGVITGADNTFHINVVLQMQGMMGEYQTDDTCWIIKSHSPWIMPEAPVFHSNKVIVIVRNPLDTCLSWLHLLSLCNHALKAPFNYEELYPNFFDWWVKTNNGHINHWM